MYNIKSRLKNTEATVKGIPNIKLPRNKLPEASGQPNYYHSIPYDKVIPRVMMTGSDSKMDLDETVIEPNRWLVRIKNINGKRWNRTQFRCG